MGCSMSDSSVTTLPYATPVRSGRRAWVWWVAIAVIVSVACASVLLITRRTLMAAQVARARAAATLAAAAAARAAIVAPTVPARVTIVQRHAQPLPGTNGTIVARIGDI